MELPTVLPVNLEDTLLLDRDFLRMLSEVEALQQVLHHLRVDELLEEADQ